MTCDTVVVGGGHAGLAMSWCLTQEGVDHVVLERGAVGQRWRDERWDSLTLLTPNWATRLPGFPYDGDAPDGFDTRDAYLAYLERYARSFCAPVRTGTTVTRVTPAAGGGLAIDTSRGRIDARNVVAATGPFHEPVIPAAGRDVPAGLVQLHSKAYRHPDQLPDGPVLVVGGGNSGLQIVMDLLAAGRAVYVSVGRLRCLPRRYRGRDAIGWLADLGALDLCAAEAPPAVQALPPPLLSGVGGGADLNLRHMAGRGAVFLGRFQGVRAGRLQFSGDLAATLQAAAASYREFRARVDRHVAAHGLDAPSDPMPCDDADLIPDATGAPVSLDPEAAGLRSVVWATGFRVAYDWIDAPVFDRTSGAPIHEGGVSPVPGLYFLGLRWLTKYKSFFIYGVGEDARRLAAHIAARGRP